MFRRIQHMLIKEFIEALRDPRMKAILLVTPILQMLIFGYAVSTDVRHVATAIVDLDNSTASREVAARFEHSGYFDVVARLADESQLRTLLDHGSTQAVLHFHKGFDTDLRAGKTTGFQVIVDGTDSNTASIILSYCQRIVQAYSQERFQERLVRVLGAHDKPARVELETRAWFNENLESRLFYIPGVICLLVLVVTTMLTSMAVVREREIGTMEQVLASPIKPGEFILGKTLPFAVFGFLDVILVSVVAVFWFEVPIRGNPLILLASAGLYLLNTLAIGLFISTVSRTQQQAMVTTFLFIFPAVLLSGFVFPILNMPLEVQWATYLNPMRYFVIISRGIFLKGVGFDILWPQMAALLALGSAILLLTIHRFKKTLA
ncbi:ABC transporter permease [Nitrospina gracilis]|uniref:ABC transporter permease n=1 Tax=Nitrospina gracilis TaxID=35801 RepID=UPI001F1DA3C5|nr:ABC transporter permease [Nitrospina gracilis]MCF8719905.1 ABC-2 type transport system permease protein [Nitrospina gracilis Nb-211]